MLMLFPPRRLPQAMRPLIKMTAPSIARVAAIERFVSITFGDGVDEARVLNTASSCRRVRAASFHRGIDVFRFMSATWLRVKSPQRQLSVHENAVGPDGIEVVAAGVDLAHAALKVINVRRLGQVLVVAILGRGGR